MSEAFSLALQQALARLKSRERFREELRQWLLAKGHEPIIVEQTLDHLAQKGMLNDERAAAELVRRKSGKRAVGRERLEEEVRALGGEAIELHETEQERALAALDAKPGAITKAQAGRFLAGRGFAEETIETVLELRFGSE